MELDSLLWRRQTAALVPADVPAAAWCSHPWSRARAEQVTLDRIPAYSLSADWELAVVLEVVPASRTGWELAAAATRDSDSDAASPCDNEDLVADEACL